MPFKITKRQNNKNEIIDLVLWLINDWSLDWGPLEFKIAWGDGKIENWKLNEKMSSLLYFMVKGFKGTAIWT